MFLSARWCWSCCRWCADVGWATANNLALPSVSAGPDATRSFESARPRGTPARRPIASSGVRPSAARPDRAKSANERVGGRRINTDSRRRGGRVGSARSLPSSLSLSGRTCGQRASEASRLSLWLVVLRVDSGCSTWFFTGFQTMTDRPLSLRFSLVCGRSVDCRWS